MSDRLRNTFPVPVVFNDGELPTAAKLNGLSRQSMQGQSIIGQAIGDLWNSSGDSFLNAVDVDDTALMIPGLARYLGPARLLNPYKTFLTYLGSVDHIIYETKINDNVAYLPVSSHPSYTPTFTGTGTLPSSKKSAKSLCLVAGDYYLSGRYFYSYGTIGSDWHIVYTPLEYEGWYGLSEPGGASWTSVLEPNIIPDPDADPYYSFQGLKIQYVNSIDNSEGYYIFLPPRMPLYNRGFNFYSNVQHPNDGTGNSNNIQSSPSVGTRLYWQSDAVACPSTGTEAEHYRYKLPSYLTRNWSQGSTLPMGSIYLWDYSQTKTIVEGVTYTAENAATPRPFLLVASGEAMDNWISSYGETLGFSTAVLQSSSHDPAYYKTGVRIVCTGADISATLTWLHEKFLSHSHVSGDYDGHPISHRYVESSYKPTDSLTAAVSSSIRFTDVSSSQNDWHPQYLHRAGSDGGSLRDRYLNAMLGDLCIASSTSTSYFQNLDADSKRLVFGTYSSGPFMKYEKIPDRMVVGNKPLSCSQGLRDYPLADATYGYSASAMANGYGYVRYRWLAPQEFFKWRAPSSYGGVSMNFWSGDPTGVKTHDTLFETQSLLLIQDATQYSFATVYIDLPFRTYSIVGLKLSCYPASGTWVGKTGHYWAWLGYSSYNSSSGYPVGTVNHQTDLYTVFSGLSASSYPAPQSIFSVSTTTPLLEVSNLFTNDANVRRPYIQFITFPVASSSLEVRDIVLLYRVKEY